MVLKSAPLLFALACASCAAPFPATQVPNAPLLGPRGEALGVRGLAERTRLTVLVFFSSECEVLARHEPRLRALVDAYRPRGVQFFMVDSETRGSTVRDTLEARRRGYPFPILGDRGARVADLLGARYSTYSVVLDSSGRVRYRGGIDSDKLQLHENASPYLRDALDDLLSGREPRVAEGKALGCALQTW